MAPACGAGPSEPARPRRCCRAVRAHPRVSVLAVEQCDEETLRLRADDVTVADHAAHVALSPLLAVEPGSDIQCDTGRGPMPEVDLEAGRPRWRSSRRVGEAPQHLVEEERHRPAVDRAIAAQEVMTEGHCALDHPS